MTTTPRQCAECGTEFPWTRRNPSRRFCSPQCKTRWWRTHGRRSQTGIGLPPRQHATPQRAGDAVSLAPTQLGVAHHCPNCQQPIEVINFFLPVDDAPAPPAG
jgi:endogenous inhibitor of DNA gyrase (YacG/DUF329 family)